MDILIADDHAIFRHGLKGILAAEFPKATFGEANTGQAALELVWKKPWDLVIIDLSMPGRGGMDVIKDIKLAQPKLPILVLSMHPEDQYAVRLLKLGASGYLTKLNAPSELIKAVNRVLEGGHYVSATLAERLATQLSTGLDKAPHETLSDREFQVMRMIASGKTVSDIAAELSLSLQTVSTHRTRLLRKMHMQTNAELVRYALEHHLVD